MNDDVASGSNPNRRKTILVVDDVPENLAMAVALLSTTYRVRVATGGSQALEVAGKARPDLILLDVGMPAMNGYEVCGLLKEDPDLCEIPVIFLTARSDEADEQLGFDLGAVDYIAKPFSPPIMLARIRAQLSLKEARDTLAQRVVEEKRRFEIALTQQIELNDLKAVFLAMATHEFRTPLTAILSSEELLRVYGDRLDSAGREATLASIEDSARRMLVMLDDAQHIGRGNRALLRFRPSALDPASLCRQLRDEALVAHPPQGAPWPEIRLDLALASAAVTLDERLLRHILGNLLSNALKYSPSGAAVRLSAREEGDSLVFEVADQGIGIPPEDLPHLFGDFHRGSNVDAIPGTGLGLAIVKRAVETHGGDIDVRSDVGQGTLFRVRIPVGHVPQEED